MVKMGNTSRCRMRMHQDKLGYKIWVGMQDGDASGFIGAQDW